MHQHHQHLYFQAHTESSGCRQHTCSLSVNRTSLSPHLSLGQVLCFPVACSYSPVFVKCMSQVLVGKCSQTKARNAAQSCLASVPGLMVAQHQVTEVQTTLNLETAQWEGYCIYLQHGWLPYIPWPLTINHGSRSVHISSTVNECKPCSQKLSKNYTGMGWSVFNKHWNIINSNWSFSIID